jgi:uncharacterized membrane protein
MKKLMILFLGILMTISSFSKTLEGIGMGNSEVTAKKRSLGRSIQPGTGDHQK